MLICLFEKSLILFIFNIIIKGPLLLGLAIKIDEMGNADMRSLYVLLNLLMKMMKNQPIYSSELGILLLNSCSSFAWYFSAAATEGWC